LNFLFSYEGPQGPPGINGPTGPQGYNGRLRRLMFTKFESEFIFRNFFLNL
jgi:hypothetical protein